MEETDGPDSGRLVESHRAFDYRFSVFYVLVGAAMAVIGTGLAYQQLFRSGAYHESERRQNERRIIIPGPRGDIYDRQGRLLVGNRPRFSIVLYLDELQEDFRREAIRIRRNYRETGDKDLPSSAQMEQIAHISVAQAYLDQVNAILGEDQKIDPTELTRHFERRRYMPYTLVDGLKPEELARLLERLPVSSPLQIDVSDERFYPYGPAACHVLGYVGIDDSPAAEDFPGGDLKTFPMPGTTGRDGLEKQFDARLQGRPGGSIFRVDQAGYKVDPPLDQRVPVQGASLTTSLDIDLQLAAEDALGEQAGAAVALDVHTGEILVLSSKPGYNLNDFSPHLKPATAAAIEAGGAWLDRAIAGLYPPGSTFKTIDTIAGLRRGTLSPDDTSVDCEGYDRIGNRIFTCDNGEGHHGRLALREAIALSCDIYFYEHGLQIGPVAIAEEARRFGLDRPTGIELPGETRRMLIPDPAWKRAKENDAWTKGDTANMAIGQGYIIVTPIGMACFAASLARGETSTRPTLLHDPDRAPQHTEPIGLTPSQRSVLLDGMEGCTTIGTAKILALPAFAIPGVRIAGKTGTAQFGNHLNVAWFICFAPLDNPEIAVAAAVQSDTPGENYAGGIYGAQVADAVLKKYFAKRAAAAPPSYSGAPPP
jgi:penicillin-binding protein 2